MAALIAGSWQSLSVFRHDGDGQSGRMISGRCQLFANRADYSLALVRCSNHILRCGMRARVVCPLLYALNWAFPP